MFQDQRFIVLRALGLSVLQAKVYLSQLEICEADAEVISQQTRIPKQDVFPVLRDLQELCVIKEIASASRPRVNLLLKPHVTSKSDLHE
jgi:sugar-specific transcriptional regulator TrmB